jgi:hypothetical protein
MRASVFALLFAACATTPGSFRPDGFHHEHVPYEVRYADAGKRSFVSADWQIDNYVNKSGTLEPKMGEGYKTRRVIELFDEEAKPVEVYAYDLRLTHRRDNGTIWMRAEFLPPRHAQRDLDSLIKNYVENLSGTGIFASYLVPTTLQTRTHAAAIVETRDLEISGFPAREAIIDIANVDRLKLDPTSRSARLRLVLIDTPYTIVRHDPRAGTTQRARCIVVAAYSNDPDRFEAENPDFDRFLTAIHLPPTGLIKYPLD